MWHRRVNESQQGTRLGYSTMSMSSPGPGQTYQWPNNRSVGGGSKIHTREDIKSNSIYVSSFFSALHWPGEWTEMQLKEVLSDQAAWNSRHFFLPTLCFSYFSPLSFFTSSSFLLYFTHHTGTGRLQVPPYVPTGHKQQRNWDSSFEYHLSLDGSSERNCHSSVAVVSSSADH